jgi:hypothetical protein
LALIKVTKGELSIQNVVVELERLIPGDWVWKVEEAGHNSFSTVFPLNNELLRMVIGFGRLRRLGIIRLVLSSL